MNKLQRIVLIVYFLLLAYCCVWIPWHVIMGEDNIRLGYGWVWSGPDDLAGPDLPLVFLRIGAATAISAAIFFISGLWRPATRG